MKRSVSVALVLLAVGRRRDSRHRAQPPQRRPRSSKSIRSGRSRCPITGCWARRSACRWTPRITSGSSIGPQTVEDNFKAADSEPPIGVCCKVAPPVLEFDQAGNLVGSWGGPGAGLRVAGQQPRHHRRSQGQRLDRRQRQHRHADPEVHEGRQVPAADRQAGRAQRQQRRRELLAAGEDLRRSRRRTRSTSPTATATAA